MFDELDVPVELREAIMSEMASSARTQPLKVRADVAITCFSYEGIDAIREALGKGAAVGTEESPVKIQLIAPPEYVMLTHSFDGERAVALLQRAIQAVRESLEPLGGKVVVSTEPHVVNQYEDEGGDADDEEGASP